MWVTDVGDGCWKRPMCHNLVMLVPMILPHLKTVTSTRHQHRLNPPFKTLYLNSASDKSVAHVSANKLGIKR